jgi:molecular chaperone HtpG
MRIRYPELFEKRLAANKKMRSAVDGTAAEFDGWLKDSKLPFFTDYTDHGPEHLNHVMVTTAALIPLEAQEKLTAEDAAILVLAVLLHDSALHLSEAGFQSLIKGKAAGNRIEGIDTTSWPNLWDEYLFSARRWDDQKLNNVFGADETGSPRGIVRDPFEFYTNLAETDRKLIGEFIRTHHPRLAHEFAVYGVPGASDESIKPASEFDASLCDLAGLVARSHGRSIRSCIDYLSWKKYNIREFQNVHAVYLMALLRVADFLHVDADRTSEVVFKYKHIPSKFSEREHKTHLAVKSITRATEDPEAIHVTAQPEDVHTFFAPEGLAYRDSVGIGSVLGCFG